MIRFRRMFPRAKRDGDDPGQVAIKDTPEVCLDLGWFMERFPLYMEDMDRDRLYRGRAAHAATERGVEALLSGASAPRPFALAYPARDYQAVAAEMALRTGGLICADQMGLGKTITALATLADARMRPALCVVETQLQLQWEAQIRKFLPAARPHILQKGKPYELPKPAPDILICNYEKLDGWADVLAPVVQGLVFDECQALRHNDTKKYEAAKHIAEHAAVRLGCSGTPIFNFGGEMYNVAEVIRPGCLGTREEFIAAWGGQTDARGRVRVKDPRALQAHLRRLGVMLRRTCKDVGRELPALYRTLHHVEADMTALTGQARSAVEYARQLLASGSSPFQRLQAGQQLDGIMRQATGLAKAPGVAALARLVLEEEDRVVIAAHHHVVHDYLRRELAPHGVVVFTGRETTKEKAAAVQAFSRPVGQGARVFLMAIRAGAGLDGLQHLARICLHAELDWSPIPHLQYEARLLRDGQPDPVHSYYCVTDEGSDPLVLDIAGVKMGQIDGLLSSEDSDSVFDAQTDPDKLRRLAELVLQRAGQRR